MKIINKKGNVQTFIGCTAAYDEAEIVIFGAGYDGTTSYRPGSRFAPAAIRAESWGIESYSPYLQKGLDEIKVYDAGDLELVGRRAEVVLDMVEEATAEIVRDGKIPLMLGGEHLVTLGAVRALHNLQIKQHPDLHIIHFDAHADLRDEYMGEKLSHATVMRRCYDLVGYGKIFQIGIRSGNRDEFAFKMAHMAQTLDGFMGKPVYFSLDLDVLDPSILPGTGTPEAGGMSFLELLNDIVHLKNFNIVGCDIVELAPNYDPSGVSTATACKILRELLLTIGGK